MKTPISTMISIGYAISGEIRKPLETENVANRQKMTPPPRFWPPVLDQVKTHTDAKIWREKTK